MNNNQGALYFGVGIDMTQWRQNVNEIRRDILGLNTTTQQQTKAMDSSFKSLALAVGTYFSGAALGNFANQIINVRGEFQKTEIAFETMLGSQEKAQALMAQMVDLAAKTPFSLQDVSAGAKQLLAFQIPAEQVVDTLTRIGNVAAGLGVPMGQLIHVYGQVKAQGKLMTNDLYQFMNAGIPMTAELAKVMGVAENQVKDLISAGKVGFPEVQKVIANLTGEGGMFFNLMEAQSKSLSGQMANLGDAWDQMLNKIGQKNEGLLSSGIQEAIYLVENYEGVIEVIASLIPIYGAYKVALMTTAAITAANNKTIASEISLLGISEKMKLGRALVTQRQTEANAREAASELANMRAKYAALQAEVSSLAIKKQSAIQSGISATAKAQEARLQLALARSELSSIQAVGTAKQIQIAQKNVEKAQNTAIATQEMASIARKKALSASIEFNTAKQSLENTAQRVGIATKTAATAAEASQVATKNANAIATTRLTVTQNIQTFATRTAASAQAFLNSTILANPYALAATLLAGLTVALYKMSSQVSYAVELQKKHSEKMNEASSNVQAHKAKVEALITAIRSENTTNDNRRKLLAQLHTLTNGRLGQLTVEEIRTGKATKAINEYINALDREARAKAVVDLKAENYKRRLELQNNKKPTFGETAATIVDSNTYKDKSGNVTAASVWRGLTEKSIESYNRNKEAEIRAIDAKDKGYDEFLRKNSTDLVETIKDTGTTNAAAAETAAKKINDSVEKIYGIDTIKGLQQRISKLNEVMETSVIGSEKYNNAKRNAEELQKKLDSILKQQDKKSFDEEMAELKRRIEVRDKILQQGYSQETADSMFPDLKGKKYIDILYETEKKLSDLKQPTEESVENLFKIKDLIREYEGGKTFIDNVNDSIERLKAKFSGQELLNKLDSLKKSVLEVDGYIPSDNDKNERDKLIQKAKEEEIKAQQAKFDALLKEQKTYQEKSDALNKEWEEMRAMAGTDAEREKIDKLFSNRQGKLDMEMIQETAEWQVAFSELEGMSETSLQAILARLLEFQEKSKGTLTLSDAAELQKAIDNVNRAANKNPFAKLSSTFTNYRTSLKAAKKAQDDYNQAQEEFGKGSKEAVAAGEKAIEADKKSLDAKKALIGQLQEGQNIFNAVGEGVMELTDAFGGMDDATKDAIGNIMAIGNAAFELGASIASGNIAGMISAGIKLIASIGKALSGDQKKERSIKRQAAALKELETRYNELAFAAERAFGAAKYDGQRDLIRNLEQQKIAIEAMMRTESSKKKADKGKIADYKAQISQINQSITELKEGIISDVLQTEIPDMAAKIGDALLDAFGKGEDGVKAVNAAFDDMVKNIMRNQLNKILEEQMKPVYDSLLKASGLNADGTGTFDGFTEAELKDLREKYLNVSKIGQEFIKGYSEIFKDLQSPDVQGLKGDIKGVTEKTAGALEAQINALRVNQVSGLEVMRNSLLNLVRIEENTRNLVAIRKDISELNAKTKNNLAGVG